MAFAVAVALALALALALELELELAVAVAVAVELELALKLAFAFAFLVCHPRRGPAIAPALALAFLASIPTLSVAEGEEPASRARPRRYTKTSMLTLRPATPADVPTILRFIRELALYEREPDAVIATEADLLRDGFSLSPDARTPLNPAPPPRFTCVMADFAVSPTEPAQPAGFALYFTSYSTWLGHHGIRLEDLYVTPDLRGRGIGKALLAHVARVAIDQGCPRLEWDVLNWNTPAIAVYESVGARPQSEWTIMRITGDPLAALAAEAPRI